MSDFDLSSFLTVVPTFDGNWEKLERFLELGDFIYLALNDEGKKVFDKYFVVKTSKKVYDWYEDNSCPDWVNFKKILRDKSTDFYFYERLRRSRENKLFCGREKREYSGSFRENVGNSRWRNMTQTHSATYSNSKNELVMVLGMGTVAITEILA